MAVFAGNGSAGSPSFTFSSDTNTGLYRTASDELGVSIGGAQKANFTGAGVLFPGNSGFEVSLTTGSSARLTVKNQVNGANTAITLSNANAGNTDGYGSHLEWENQGAISRISCLRTGVGAANKFVFRLTDLGNTQADRLLLDADYLRLLSGTGGIQFNGDTAAANALDDYEEGTWVPVPNALGAASQPVYTSSGRYIKIGKLVYLTGVINVSVAAGAGATQTQILGLPFIAGSSGSALSIPQTNFTPIRYDALSATTASSSTPTGAYIYEQLLLVTSLFSDTTGLQSNHGWVRTGTLSFAMTYQLL